MKKTITLLAILTATIVSCNSDKEKLERAERKVENAENNVVTADQNLVKAKEAYIMDMEKYKVDMQDKINENDAKANELTAKMSTTKNEMNTKYAATIANLQMKNKEIKEKLNAYTAEGADKWNAFRLRFNTEVDSVAKALNNITNPNSRKN